jgi:Beta-galactosidase
MRNLLAAFFLILIGSSSAFAKTVVFWQDGFPTVASQPIARETLVKALDGLDPVFVGLEGLKDAAALNAAELLVLPYGSAVPADVWDTIHSYLKAGGNVLVLGGQPFRVPIRAKDGRFVEGRPQDSYSRELNLVHTYEIPRPAGTKFAWKFGYAFLPSLEVRARRFFAVQGEPIDGLGYMMNAAGDAVAAPVIVADHNDVAVAESAMLGSRFVMLDFEPEPGYWESADGVSLVRAAANYGRQGATLFWIETLFSTLNTGESPRVVAHLRDTHRERASLPQTGTVRLELLSGDTLLDAARIPCSQNKVDADLDFQKKLAPGFYTIRGVYEDSGRPREFYQNGFWVEDEKLLASGPVLGVHGDTLTSDGKPFFPFGVNYFTTDDEGWEFSGPRNAWVWERDFAKMAKHGVTFVRTGVWGGNLRFVDTPSGDANERFVRNLEAYFLSARRHGIFVNFTFFAFEPLSVLRDHNVQMPVPGPGTNPYTDSVAIRNQQDYLLSIVNRFKDVPWLCWDLINEPSFSSPKRLWRGNTPNGDPSETAAWHKWLQDKYGSLAELASAWSVTPEQLGSFESIPFPKDEDLALSRNGDSREVRAVDYNLFAQDMFSEWVRSMVSSIRAAGSKQLIDVGQDEGGVADRVLNQFYGGAGVSFTTNHTYWRDDALLWGSLAAKRPGVPNIIGETGYQPVSGPDGTWRYDEITGAPLLERKWALGFAAANTGTLHWDWARDPDFGMMRSDGSNKTWIDMLAGMGEFARKAAPWATEVIPPQVAIVLPQSLQLSVWNPAALEAQQKSVRALYHYARTEAYVVGEYQIELLGNPKLIILPSPFVLTQSAWQAVLDKVKAGATLLVTGRFDQDAHFHPTGRQTEIGLDYEPGLLTSRETLLKWPGGEARLTWSGEKTTYLDRAFLPGGTTWAEKTLGKGKILFAALPLELNDNLQAIGDVYHYAANLAGVAPAYSTTLQDPGILIAPTRFPRANLYVLTSESSQPEVSFRDQASGKLFTGRLDPGRAALLLIGSDGSVLASYNWKQPTP